jgi:hypothetical protein
MAVVTILERQFQGEIKVEGGEVRKLFQGAAAKMIFISITRLRLRSWRFVPIFFVQAIRSGRQAKAAAGNLGVTVMREGRNVFWTRTAWTDEASMKAYMLAGAHRSAMRELLNWCDEAAMAHWIQESAELPSWQEAYTELMRVGRLSKVNHPSKSQTKFEVPEPRVAPGSEMRW